MKTKDRITLIPWASTVASAAPAAAISNTATNKRSPRILKIHAINTVNSGVLDSPIPRKILPSTLYAMINADPAEQI